MYASTLKRLKDAALTAAQEDDFLAAQELLGLLALQPFPKRVPAPLSLPAANNRAEAFEHDAVFWGQVVRDSFLPFLAQHGRNSFTSFELYKWVQYWDGVSLTEWDLKPYKNGRETWRERASDALSNLCRMGILDKEHNSKIYYFKSLAACAA